MITLDSRGLITSKSDANVEMKNIFVQVQNVFSTIAKTLTTDNGSEFLVLIQKFIILSWNCASKYACLYTSTKCGCRKIT